MAVQWLQASVQLTIEAVTKPILPYCNECETEETERSNRPYPGWKLNLLQPAKSSTALPQEACRNTAWAEACNTKPQQYLHRPT